MKGSLLLARATLAAARGLVHLLPARARKALDDRFFGAVFQATRVTNDAYGWRPPEPAAPAEEPSR